MLSARKSVSAFDFKNVYQDFYLHVSILAGLNYTSLDLCPGTCFPALSKATATPAPSQVPLHLTPSHSRGCKRPSDENDMEKMFCTHICPRGSGRKGGI